MKKIGAVLVFSLMFVFIFAGCEEQPKYSNWEAVEVNLSEIELHWEQSYFVHDELRVEITENWSGIGKKSDFDNLDKHDLVFQYEKRTKTYQGTVTIESKLKDIDEEPPKSSKENFVISIVGVNIDSKLLIQDELANDYYYKYEYENYTNFCYFRIAKNDVNQLKVGSFNSIRLELRVLTHIDGTKSFQTDVEDGITDVGKYDKVGIYFDPDLQVS